MSAENMEIARRVFQVFQDGVRRGDPGAVFESELMSPDTEWVPNEGFPGPAKYTGREGFVDFIDMWTEDFEDWSIRSDRLIDAGDRIVHLIHQSGTGRGSGAKVEWDLALIYTIENGQVIRVNSYLDPTEALEAAGLSE